MSKIIYLGVPAHGHLNPMLPVASELIQRGETIIIYNGADFRPQIEATGAAFRPYPATRLSAHALNDSVKDGNLANSSVLMLHAAEDLLPFLLSELERERPDLVIFDSLAAWGKMATTILDLRAAASITPFIFDLKSSRLDFTETLNVLRLLSPIFRRLCQSPSPLCPYLAKVRISAPWGRFPRIFPSFNSCRSWKSYSGRHSSLRMAA